MTSRCTADHDCAHNKAMHQLQARLMRRNHTCPHHLVGKCHMPQWFLCAKALHNSDDVKQPKHPDRVIKVLNLLIYSTIRCSEPHIIACATDDGVIARSCSWPLLHILPGVPAGCMWTLYSSPFPVTRRSPLVFLRCCGNCRPARALVLIATRL
jgi:hypothetical protein